MGFRTSCEDSARDPRALEVQGNITVVDLIAPLAVRFDRGKVASSPDRMSVALRAAADIFVEKAELVWTVVATGDPPRHDSARLGEREWAHEDGALRSRLDIPIRKGDAAATLFILVGGRCVDCVSVPLAGAGSNVRMRTHNVVDPGLRRFLEHLRPERWHKATEFGEAVGLLFLFLGFHVDPLYTQSGLGDAVDSLAHDPASSVILAIECTVGPPDAKAKLSKLIARSADMRSKLRDSEVIPVLATAIRMRRCRRPRWKRPIATALRFSLKRTSMTSGRRRRPERPQLMWSAGYGTSSCKRDFGEPGTKRAIDRKPSPLRHRLEGGVAMPG